MKEEKKFMGGKQRGGVWRAIDFKNPQNKNYG